MIFPDSNSRWDKIVLGIYLAIILMAVVVLIGWHAHVRAAVQIFQGLIPMQYNTALSFLALAVAGIALSTNKRALMCVASCIAAVMGTLVVVEYATRTSIGIDTLFFYPWEQTLSADPGRMAITTAISFFLTGATLLILAIRPRAYALLGIVNLIPLSLALTSLIGYAFQITYVLPFYLGSQMALHTSAAFLAYEGAILGYAWHHAERGPDGLPRWAAGIGVAFLPVLLVVASGLFSRQTWRMVPVEMLFSIVGVALITLAVLKLNRAKVAYKGALMIGSTLILLISLVGLVVHVKHQSEAADVWARHSTQVIDVSQSLLGHLAEAESATRGYLIHQDNRFLTQYQRSTENITRSTRELRDVVADNPLQEASAIRVQQLTLARMDYFKHVVDLVRAGQTRQATAIIQGMKGPDLTEQIHAEMRVFLQEEDRLSGERRQVLARLWQQLSWLLVAGTAAAVLLASTLIILFSSGISRRLWQVRDNAVNLAAGKAMAAPLEGNDEIAELDRAFHAMANSLDEASRREKAVIGGSIDWISIKDAHHRFLMINQAGAELFHKSEAEIIGTSIHDVFTPESARRICARDDEILAGGETASYELQATTRAGEKRTFWSTRVPYRDGTGKIVGVISINRDISAQKQIANELECARDTALASARLKSEFLANMSHEIRTPMNGVIGMTGLLLDTEMSATQLEYTRNIESSAEALLIIINDILDFSKIEAGLLRFEKIAFELRAVVEGPVVSIAERAHAKGLELAAFVHEDVPTNLLGDPGRLRQVLTNLVGNAVKFTEHGEVVVNVSRVTETKSHVIVRFEVQDTGIGVSSTSRARLFDPFTQADGSMTRRYGGTGLGLSISKQLVELMGGQIGLDSRVGSGSTFWFTAKFEKQTHPVGPQCQAPGALNGVKVLIVDDNARNRQILDQQARSWGMLATQAESGEQALELLRGEAAKGEPFVLAMLDLMMPAMDGFELAQAIKSDSATASTLLVLLPSYGRRGHGQRARQLGIAAYLEKPVRQAQLHDCLLAVIARGPEPVQVTPPPLLTRHSLREDELRSATLLNANVRIIIAEDDAINQQVALGQLQTLGYHAEVATNGRELLAAMEQTDYDLVLMDCQMPVMDGYAATAEIRRREGASRRTIIIAMTANALDGDRDKCLAAGMDDYLSKPIKSERLRLMLRQWLTASDGAHPVTAGNHKKVPVLDQAHIASLRLVPQTGFLAGLIDVFIDEAALSLKAIHEAVGRDDKAEVHRLAHRLKGSCANMGATQMAAVAAGLEGDDRDQVAASLPALEREFLLLRTELAAERLKTTR